MPEFHSFIKLSISHPVDILFIHSSVSGHVGGFHLLDTVNNAAAVNLGVQMFLKSFPWDLNV